jgi:hypothetical protein
LAAEVNAAEVKTPKPIASKPTVKPAKVNAAPKANGSRGRSNKVSTDGTNRNPSQFIRDCPLDMKATDVVTAGKTVGLEFSVALVYNTRKYDDEKKSSQISTATNVVTPVVTEANVQASIPVDIVSETMVVETEKDVSVTTTTPADNKSKGKGKKGKGKKVSVKAITAADVLVESVPVDPVSLAANA